MNPTTSGADVRLDGRTVVVTGAGAGLGRGLAASLAACGANVVVTARRAEPRESLVEEIRVAGGTAAAVGCDVTDRHQVEAAVASALDTFGSLDAVVHNAASRYTANDVTLEALSDDEWNDHVGVALRGALYFARAAFVPLREQRGSFVVLTSLHGIEGIGNQPAYAAVKEAQRGFVKSLAKEWGPHGIRVNGLAPVAQSEAFQQTFGERPEYQAAILRGIPLGRFGDPITDIGPVVAFLVSRASSYMTGQTFLVSGGTYAGL